MTGVLFQPFSDGFKVHRIVAASLIYSRRSIFEWDALNHRPFYSRPSTNIDMLTNYLFSDFSFFLTSKINVYVNHARRLVSFSFIYIDLSFSFQRSKIWRLNWTKCTPCFVCEVNGKSQWLKMHLVRVQAKSIDPFTFFTCFFCKLNARFICLLLNVSHAQFTWHDYLITSANAEERVHMRIIWQIFNWGAKIWNCAWRTRRQFCII